MDVSRLAQIIWLDAGRKGDIMGNETLSPEVIQNGFSITSQVNHSMAILPANNNVQSEPARKETIVKEFRVNERQVIANKTVDLSKLKIAYPVPTAQKVKTSIFAASVNSVVHLSPIQEFSMFGKLKSQPQNLYVAYKAEGFAAAEKAEAVATHDIVYDDVVVPFKRKTLSIAS